MNDLVVTGVGQIHGLDMSHSVVIAQGSSLAIARNLDLGRLFEQDDQLEDLEHASVVIGVGAGTTMDRARMWGDRLKAPVVLVPTVLSTDAPFSSVVAERSGEAVVYREMPPPAFVVLDESVLSVAPWRFHLLGLGDVLAIESATRDMGWRGVSTAGVEVARDLLRTIDRRAEWLATPSFGALRFLSEIMQRKVALGAEHGHSYFEEGTEHFLAYLWEARGLRMTFHGELLWGGLCACSVLQNWPARVIERFQRLARVFAGVFRPPIDLGGDPEVLAALLGGAGRYCRTNGYENTILAQDIDVDIVSRAARAWSRAEF